MFQEVGSPNSSKQHVDRYCFLNEDVLSGGISVEFHCHIRWPNDPWMGGVTCLRLNNYPETLHNEFLLDNWMKQPFLLSCFRGCWYFMMFGIPRFEWLLHGVCVNFLQYPKTLPTWELHFVGLSKWKSFPNRDLNQNGWNQHLDTIKIYKNCFPFRFKTTCFPGHRSPQNCFTSGKQCWMQFRSLDATP